MNHWMLIRLAIVIAIPVAVGALAYARRSAAESLMAVMGYQLLLLLCGAALAALAMVFAVAYVLGRCRRRRET